MGSLRPASKGERNASSDPSRHLHLYDADHHIRLRTTEDIDDAREKTDKLSENDDADRPPEELAFECPRPCVLSAAPAPTDEALVAREIDKKLASMDDWTRNWVFASPVGDVVKLAGRRGYRRYEGLFGSAIIFNDYSSTYVSYGPLLDTWERSFGFSASPLGDPYDDQGAVRQDFDYVAWSGDISNPCFQDAAAYLRWVDGRPVSVFTEVRYQNSLDPNHPYLSPPEYRYYDATPLPNIFNELPSRHLWCGPPHPGWSDPNWQDPNEEFDPTTI